jgi:hypothetical protein
MLPSLHRLPKCRVESQQVHARPFGRFGVQQQTFHLHETLKSIVVFWVPGHWGLPGYEAAKEAAVLEDVTSDQVLGSDVTYLHRAVTRQMDTDSSQQSMSGETNPQVYRCDTLPQLQQTWGGYACMPSDWSHSFFTHHSVKRWPDTCL